MEGGREGGTDRGRKGGWIKGFLISVGKKKRKCFLVMEYGRRVVVCQST